MSRVRMPKQNEVRETLVSINELLPLVLREWVDVLNESYTPDRGNSGMALSGGSRQALHSDPTAVTAISHVKVSQRNVCKNAWTDILVCERMLRSALDSLKAVWSDDEIGFVDRFCTNPACGDPSKVALRRGLCNPCYVYFNRTGREPGADVIAKRDATRRRRRS